MDKTCKMIVCGIIGVLVIYITIQLLTNVVEGESLNFDEMLCNTSIVSDINSMENPTFPDKNKIFTDKKCLKKYSDYLDNNFSKIDDCDNVDQGKIDDQKQIFCRKSWAREKLTCGSKNGINIENDNVEENPKCTSFNDNNTKYIEDNTKKYDVPCETYPCKTNECCVKRDKCKTADSKLCPTNYNRDNHTEFCEGETCTIKECCIPTCTHYYVNNMKQIKAHLKKNKLHNDESKKNNSFNGEYSLQKYVNQCTKPNETCREAISRPDGKNQLKPNDNQYLPNGYKDQKCLQAECTNTDCFRNLPTCADYYTSDNVDPKYKYRDRNRKQKYRVHIDDDNNDTDTFDSDVCYSDESLCKNYLNINKLKKTQMKTQDTSCSDDNNCNNCYRNKTCSDNTKLCRNYFKTDDGKKTVTLTDDNTKNIFRCCDVNSDKFKQGTIPDNTDNENLNEMIENLPRCSKTTHSSTNRGGQFVAGVVDLGLNSVPGLSSNFHVNQTSCNKKACHWYQDLHDKGTTKGGCREKGIDYIKKAFNTARNSN
jgi:hypothetical protein